MGNAFPSRRLRALLPLRAGRFPRNAPRCSNCLSSLNLRSSSPRHLPWCISDHCQSATGFAFLAALAALTHARETSPSANGPSGIDSCVVQMADQPLPRPPLTASPMPDSGPVPPRLSPRTCPVSVTGHAGARVRGNIFTRLARVIQKILASHPLNSLRCSCQIIAKISPLNGCLDDSEKVFATYQ